MDAATTLAAVSLVMTTLQTCFLAYLNARFGENYQRITELQAQAQHLQDSLPH